MVFRVRGTKIHRERSGEGRGGGRLEREESGGLDGVREDRMWR